MALVTKATDVSIDAAMAITCPQLSGDLIAGEDLGAVAPCYIRADGKIMQSNGTAANEAASFAGFTARAVKAGQAVTLFSIGNRFRYATGLTPGQRLYIAATAGRLDTAATVGDAVGVARAINDTDIQVTRAI